MRFLVLLLLLLLLACSSVFAHGSSHAESCVYNQRGLALISDCVKEGKYYQRVDSDFYTEHRQIERLKEQTANDKSTATILFWFCLILAAIVLWLLFTVFTAQEELVKLREYKKKHS